MTPAPKRWFRWSLRTMFVVVTVFGGWLGYSANWIRQRHDFLARQTALLEGHGLANFAKPLSGDVMAPSGLGLLGESGNSAMGVIIVVERIDEFDEAFDWESHETMREARSLFPEAFVGYGVVESDPDSSKRQRATTTDDHRP
jgi:hypothetical protein